MGNLAVGDKGLFVSFLVVQHTLGEEAICVEPREEHIFHDVLHSGFHEPQLLASHNRRVDEVEAKGIGTIFVDYQYGIGVVLQPLAHFLPIAIILSNLRESRDREDSIIPRQDEAVNDYILKCRLIKERRREDKQSVEPSSALGVDVNRLQTMGANGYLINAFSDKVGGEALLEEFLVFEGIVALGIRHAGGKM